MIRARSSWLRIAALLLTVGCWSVAPAQDIWEYSPYQVHIWVATGGSAELSDALNAAVRQVISDRCEAAIRAPWNTQVIAAPPELETEMLTRMSSIQPDDVLQSSREVALADKLFLVAIHGQADTIRIQVREFDSKSREFGNLIERQMGDVTQVGHQAFAAILAAFRPIAKVESTKDRDKKVSLRIRAAGLVTRLPSPILIEPGALLQPFVRNNDRNGEPNQKLGIQKTPWTYCLVLARDDSIISCEIHSGTRVPVSGRPNQRIQRFAVLVPTTPGNTLLVLQSTAKRPEPLSGYDIYAKDPRTDKQELIGRTDWRGTMEIPIAENPLRLIYVRNGSQLLARLPMIPGIESSRVVQINSDDLRLQVEGMLAGVQSWIMDVVANRQLVKARFHKRLGESKLADAKKLLDEYATIDSRDTIEKVLNDQQAKRKSEHAPVQKRIDKLFETTRGLLTKHVDPDEGTELGREFEERRGDAALNSPAAGNTPTAPAREAGKSDLPKSP